MSCILSWPCVIVDCASSSFAIFGRSEREIESETDGIEIESDIERKRLRDRA